MSKGVRFFESGPHSSAWPYIMVRGTPRGWRFEDELPEEVEALDSHLLPGWVIKAIKDIREKEAKAVQDTTPKRLEIYVQSKGITQEIIAESDLGAARFVARSLAEFSKGTEEPLVVTVFDQTSGMPLCAFVPEELNERRLATLPNVTFV